MHNMSGNNKKLVPEAKEALERFKMEAANEVGVNLSKSYNGDITAKQAGSVGGQMVNIICPVRHYKYNRNLRSVSKHFFTVEYIVSLIS